METALELLKGLRYIRLELSVLEQRIRKQEVEMRGFRSLTISDMPRNQHMPEGLDRAVAAKEALEREQRESIACLYEKMRTAEQLLQEEGDADMRVLMRLYYVEEKPLSEVCRCMYMGKAKACRINKKVREKYARKKMIPAETT